MAGRAETVVFPDHALANAVAVGATRMDTVVAVAPALGITVDIDWFATAACAAPVPLRH